MLHRLAPICLLLLSINTSFANQSWLTDQGNAGHTGYIPIQTNPANYHLLWERKIGAADHRGYVSDSPIILNDHLYYLIRDVIDYVIAIDSSTGKTIWSKSLGEQGNARISGLYYYDGKLITVARDLSMKQMVSLNADNGNVLTTTQIPSDFNIFDLYQNDLLMDTFCNGSTPILSSTNLKEDKINWEYSHDNHSCIIPEHAMNNHYIMIRNHKSLSFLDSSTGQLSFNMNLPKGNQPSGLIRYPVLDTRTNTAYIVDGDYEMPTSEATLYAMDLETKSVRWQLPMQAGSTNPVVVENTVFSVSSDDQTLNAINAVTGKIEWTWQPDEGGDIFPEDPPIATTDVIFVEGNKNTYAVSLATHKTVWKIPRFGRMSIADGKLFIIYHVGKGKDKKFDYVAAVALN